MMIVMVCGRPEGAALIRIALNAKEKIRVRNSYQDMASAILLQETKLDGISDDEARAMG
jgi:hypothetical protein